MAKNMKRHFDSKKTFTGAATSPTTPASGDPCIVGKIPCVAITAESTTGTDMTGNATGDATFARDGSWLVSVKGIDGSGNSAVAIGDEIFYTDGDTPPLSKKATGVHWGFANGVVLTSATTTIEVFLGWS